MDTLLPDSSGVRRTADTASPPAYAGSSVAFGEFLRRARERRGFTLQQISNATKIPWRHLDALEHGNLAAVPGGMYRRGEIRAYAEVVGLDKQLALSQLERALESSAPHNIVVAAATRTKRPALSSQHAQFALALAATFALYGVARWVEGTALTDDVRLGSTGAVEQPLGLAAASNNTVPVTHETVVTTPTLTSPPRLASDRQATAAADAPLDPPVTPRPVTDLETVLVVTTAPAGARVTVNGIGWGVTPVTIRHLPSGSKRIRVTKDQYASEERSVELAERQGKNRVHIPLRRTP